MFALGSISLGSGFFRSVTESRGGNDMYFVLVSLVQLKQGNSQHGRSPFKIWSHWTENISSIE